MPAEDDEIEIKASLRDELSLPADKAAEAVDNLGDSAQKASVKVEELAASEGHAARQSKDLRGEAEKTAVAMKASEAATKRNRDELGRFTGEEKKNEKQTEKNKKSLKGFITIGADFGRLMKVIKFNAIVSGLSQATTGVVALGAAAYGAVAGLAPLSGTLIAYPGLLAAAAQGMAVFKMSTGGISDALKGMSSGDTAATAKAMKGMAPDAQAFVKQLHSLDTVWKNIGKNTQNQLFKGLATDIKGLAHDYIPIFNKELTFTARQLNKVVQQTVAWLSHRREMEAVNQVMHANGIIVGNLGTAGSQMLRGLLFVLRAADPMLMLMSDNLKSLAIQFSRWASSNGTTMRRFFMDSYLQMRKTIRVVMDFVDGLYNIGKASGAMSRMLGGGMQTIAKNFKDWTGSREGQTRMRAFFREMVPPVREMGRLLRDVGKAFLGIATAPGAGKGLTGTIRQIRTEFLPALVKMVHQLNNSNMIKSLIDLATAFANLGGSGIIGDSSKLIEQFAQIVNKLADAYSKLPEPLKTWITYLLTLSTILGKLHFGVLFRVMFGTQIKRLFTDLGAAITEDLIPALGEMIAPILAAAAPFLIVAAAIAAVVAVFVILYKHNATFRGWVNGIVNYFVNMWNQHLLPAITATWHWFESVWNKIRPFVMGVVHILIGGFRLYAAWVGTEMKIIWAVVKVAFAIIKGVAKVFFAFFKVAWALAWGVVKIAFAIIKTTAKIAFAFISAAVKAWWTRSKPVFDIFKSVASAAFHYVGKIVGPIVNGMVKVMQKIGDVASSVGDKVKHFIGGAFDWLAGKVNAVVGPIERTINRIVGGINSAGDKLSKLAGKAGGIFGTILYTGGPVTGGQTALVGELGPEAFVNNIGKVNILGSKGPEVVKFPSAGAVIPASATSDPFGGATGEAPSWAVSALQRASQGLVDGAMPQRHATPAAEPQMQEPMQVSVGPIYATAEVDVENAVMQALRKAERLRRERS